MIISIFGNSVLEKDSILIKLLPQLRKNFPKHQFVHQDPTENLQIPEGEWWILDAAEGISEITIFDQLDHFVKMKSSSVHDYDLYTELKLKQKIGQLPKIKIIALPTTMKEKEFLSLIGNFI
ncbi:hypothetical protein A3J15_02740 [Candidatus Roizmanbacteria bacterium RIFCSPLOWO2_02_FULL_38_10]|uniref:Uncharacterized protein n=1 Tax=Candidatus Roizmanbacteria bacterium RIFCSPLOWO2_02_FULL_38_10 TaxID=1802074 RepID=A0A1F7JK08_9BACT|nr:MAG: hypothetical protein A3J15_02740 [Candidatus Roizmanbacteria bacterium RIFCSPLOWO2_02_FULL_38_10]